MAETVKRLYGPTSYNSPTGSALTVYTVPTNTTTVIRNIVILTSSGATNVVYILLNGSAVMAFTLSGSSNSVLSNTSLLVLNTGDTLGIQSISSVTATLSVYGVEIT